MPLYDYKCRACGHVWAVVHSMAVDNAPEELGLTCPVCGSTDVFKFLGGRKTLGIKFVGTGFAGNDAALDAIGMPKSTQNSPEARKHLFRD